MAGWPFDKLRSAEHVAGHAAPAVVDPLLGLLRFRTRRLDHAPAGVALGGLWPHLVEADD
jgi:hypothetical protein